MAGPLSGIASYTQTPISQQTQGVQPQKRDSTLVNDNSKQSDDANKVSQTSQTPNVVATQETETSTTGNSNQQNSVLASADAQTVNDEQQRGSLVDLSV